MTIIIGKPSKKSDIAIWGTTIKCDICEKKYRLKKKQQYDLERGGFIVYCKVCADKLNLNKMSALNQGIKIYKM